MLSKALVCAITYCRSSLIFCYRWGISWYNHASIFQVCHPYLCLSFYISTWFLHQEAYFLLCLDLTFVYHLIPTTDFKVSTPLGFFGTCWCTWSGHTLCNNRSGVDSQGILVRFLIMLSYNVAHMTRHSPLECLLFHIGTFARSQWATLLPFAKASRVVAVSFLWGNFLWIDLRTFS